MHLAIKTLPIATCLISTKVAWKLITTTLAAKNFLISQAIEM